MSIAIALAERGILGDELIAFGIRRLLRQRLATQRRALGTADFDAGPLAIHTAAANAQHYEAPPVFFQQMLGPRMKYSCCCYATGRETLAEAEEAMLALSCVRAEVKDGMELLDLGCGWGSLSLWMAEQYPASRITAVSNSRDQGAFIREQCTARGLRNVEVITADINTFRPAQTFDRILSIEMFEHLRNYELLFRRIRTWLKPGGELFVHVFCHREFAYPFETEGDDNWMGRHFFTGGTMPSWDLLTQFDAHLTVRNRWKVNGRHYARTCQHWLDQLDASKEEALSISADFYGPEEGARALQRWRMFLLACRELFAYHEGEEWHVGHYRFAPPA